MAITIAVELCLKRPNTRVCYVAPRLKQAKAIVDESFTYILAGCPEDIRPAFNREKSEWKFPNGSKMILAGCNANEIEALRGTPSEFIIVDECGFMDRLSYALRSVLIPKLNATKGRMMLISTLPKEPGHEFMTEVADAQLHDYYISKTIYDCPRYTDTEIAEFAKDVGGFDSTDFKREYLNILIPDQDLMVIPEFNDETVVDIIVSQMPSASYKDRYVSMDIGVKDLTAILFAYVDVVRGKDTTTQNIHATIESKEKQIWADAKPLLRVADNNNLILLNDLNQVYNLYFNATAKDNKIAQINNLRILIANGRVKIHERCKRLIFHLKNATWNAKGTDYGKARDGSHYDFVDSLS
jgi:hypothetical protein